MAEFGMPASSSVPRPVINAWGTPTPFGVSASDAVVAEAAASMLQRHVVMAELQAEAGRRLAQWSGSEAGCVTHCTAAAVTLSVAACMAGGDAGRIARLPDTGGMPGKVAMLEAHQVNYGHAITQAVRLAGARPVACATPHALGALLQEGGFACVLAVESQLAAGSGPALTGALARIAHAHGVPLVVDAAAQDWRAAQLVQGGADLVLLSAQKYLRAPTAGLVLGKAQLVTAVDAQHAGIGRGMKPTKEAIAGVLAALALRGPRSHAAWCAAQAAKLDAVAIAVQAWPGVRVVREADPLGNGFERLWLALDTGASLPDAVEAIRRLRKGDPVVAVAPHRASQNMIGLELSGTADGEVATLIARLADVLRPAG